MVGFLPGSGGYAAGIMCHLDVPGLESKALVTSITHLLVDQAMPVAREVAAYQKRRIKRLRRQVSAEP